MRVAGVDLSDVYASEAVIVEELDADENEEETQGAMIRDKTKRQLAKAKNRGKGRN